MESHETRSSLKSENIEKIFLKIIMIKYFYLKLLKKVKFQCRNICLRISNDSKNFNFNKCEKVCGKTKNLFDVLKSLNFGNNLTP